MNHLFDMKISLHPPEYVVNNIISGDKWNIGLEILTKQFDVTLEDLHSGNVPYSLNQSSQEVSLSDLIYSNSSLNKWGESIANFATKNFGDSFMVSTNPKTAKSYTITMLYTPGRFEYKKTDDFKGFLSEPAIGESSFTLYFYDYSENLLGSVDCSIRFKASTQPPY